MKRVIALLAAAAMIIGALWYRGVFDSDGTVRGQGDDSRPTRILCASELKAVCATAFGQNLDITLVPSEDPGTTAQSLTTTTAEWDVWVVSEPWPGIAESRAKIAGGRLALRVSDPIASQPLRLVRSTSAAFNCPDGDVACALTSGRPAGLRPATTTGGILGAVAVASGVLGLDDFATNDLDDGAVEQALAGVADSADQAADPVTRFLAQTGAFDAVADIGAVVPASRANRASVTDDTPGRNALAVLVSPADQEGPDSALAEMLTQAMTGTPWRPINGTTPASGLPEPAVVDAVARLWAEASK